MDLAVYLISATVTCFLVGATVALTIAALTGQFSDLDAAARLVLEIDEPMPTHARHSQWEGDR